MVRSVAQTNPFTIALAVLVLACPALGQLEWRVSVKFILDGNGNRPGEVAVSDPNCASMDCSAISCDSEVYEKFDYANAVLARMGRGYRFNVIEVVDVTGLETFFDGPGGADTRGPLEDLVTATQASKDLYLFDDNALNIYIINTCVGGFSNTRAVGQPAPLTIIGQVRQGAIVRPFHEMGHTLGLCHTHGGCGICSDNQSGASCATATSGDDCLPDTLRDFSGCDSADAITQLNGLGASYASLGCTDRERVLDVLYNIMSYHQDNDQAFDWANVPCDVDSLGVSCADDSPPAMCRHRLSPDQLDRITDRTNAFWPLITNGKTHFVDRAAAGTPDGSSQAPFDNVTLGLFSALAGTPKDIVLIRGGAYNESPTITFPVTLRATRGNAVIGR